MKPIEFNLNQVKPLPLAERRSLTQVDDILIDPVSEPGALEEALAAGISKAAEEIRAARERGASVVLIYGAHLLRNGAALIMERLLAGDWITHLATNGAGTIHDWEYAWLGRSTESVRENVATGTFGAWDETSRNIHLALLAGGLTGLGYGEALGAFIMQDGCRLPDPEDLTALIRDFPDHPLTSARADLLHVMQVHKVTPGRHDVAHPWKHASIVGQAFRHGVPLTVHPGIGYDIISCHPMFSGSAIGRAGHRDFESFCRSVMSLDGGVVMSVGSAIMGPQVFEKSLSCVNNVRLQEGRETVRDHNIHVVDLQPGDWDWSGGEPPKDHPAYYLRFCKSYARMGGNMEYHCCDNAAFLHHLWKKLE